MRGETSAQRIMVIPHHYFNPLSPCGERRQAMQYLVTSPGISIHSPHAGRDYWGTDTIYSFFSFQSTLPMRGETLLSAACKTGHGFQSTLPMRGETCEWADYPTKVLISIHSPHAGRDMPSPGCKHRQPIFQSTLPMRGETLSRYSFAISLWNFNPLSPCGERPPSSKICADNLPISIHSPHAGRDGIG